jgi:hypothetical protein
MARCCRRFAAFHVVSNRICGLMPAAMCWRHSVAEDKSTGYGARPCILLSSRFSHLSVGECGEDSTYLGRSMGTRRRTELIPRTE